MGSTETTSLKPEKNAGLVMGTNSSSIVSKRSVERLYFPKPHFFKYFVRKFQRRSPTINRGYWLRMKAIENVVRTFLNRPTSRRKVIMNLGCGFDPLPFQWLSKEKELCRDVQFLDVDYEELMISKADIIRENDALTELVRPLKEPSGHTVIQTDQYVGIGCDLRDLEKLDQAIQILGGLNSASVLCIAEVSVAYMEPLTADSVFKWARDISDDVTFGLLEQFLPDGADHPFACTMLNHFKKLRTPLRSVESYPDANRQRQRFLNRGWKEVNFTNLWELWSDPAFLAPSERLWLDDIEPFDEWEEFALFAGHYFLLRAHSSSDEALVMIGNPSGASCNASGSSVISPSLHSENYCSTHIAVPKGRGLRRHGAVLKISNGARESESMIVHLGGVDFQGRCSSTDTYVRNNASLDSLSAPSWRLSPRQSHTITKLSNGNSVLVGGRASPAVAMNDCYLQIDQGWQTVQSAPSPIFRHGAAAVVLPGGVPALLVFGGKTAGNKILRDCLLWDSVNGWRLVPILYKRPQPRFGAIFASTGETHGILVGGCRPDGVILQEVKRWKLLFRGDQLDGIAFTSCTPTVPADLVPHFGRFGASFCFQDDHLFLIGGISTSGCIPRSQEVLALDTSGVFPGDEVAGLDVTVSKVSILSPPDQQRPLLVGHSSANLGEREIVIAGGGAVCFSFGTCWNSGIYVIRPQSDEVSDDWYLREDSTTASSAEVTASTSLRNIHQTPDPGLSIDKTRLLNSSDFSDIVRWSRPKVFDELDFGTCRESWTREYLLQKIGAERQVVVHETENSHMNFQRKDFAYVKKPFSRFLEEIYAGGHQYLRSVSSGDSTKEPANLERDFPEIAPDFQIPPELQMVHERMHSSPLRITGNVSMWLHVDTMANVLFQIAGTKRLILFPPADFAKLSIPHGSTTSTLDIFPEADGGDVSSIPDTHPREVTLHAGEVLFIPPLWAHTAAAPQEVSIAVNVFFRSLHDKAYAPGRDVYGNRDIEAYEAGRRDVARIARRFKDTPSDLSQAYLLRLADELRTKAMERGPLL